METPGSRLQQARQQLRLSMEAFGAPLGMSRPSISNWEAGKSEISMVSALAIQAIYGYRWEWLLMGEDPMWVADASTPVGTIQVPILEVADGHPIPNPGADTHLFKKRFLDDLVKRSGAGVVDNLYMVRVADDALRPLLGVGSLALVNPALELRRSPVNTRLYLARKTSAAESAMVRRVYWDRADPENPYILLSATESQGTLVPLQGVDITDIVLGYVCWYTSPEDTATPNPK